MTDDTVFAPARTVEDLNDCYFYHTMDLPGFGTVAGEWDLRAGVDDYLGHVETGGKRVLDVGTASGFLAFTLENRGAEVVGYDLPPGADIDVVPFAGTDLEAERARWRDGLRRLQNSFWLARRALGSEIRVAYGSVYDVPPALGTFDLAVVGSLLLHLRDPFRALEQVAARTRKAVVVTDVLARRSLLVPALARWFGPSMLFLPRADRQAPRNAWWNLAPRAVAEMLGVLGFPSARITYHSQPFLGRPVRLFTVVASR